MEIRFELNGRTVDPDKLADSITAEILKAIKTDLRTKIGSIRHPGTGEFPVLVVRGHSLDNLSIEVSGSPELVALVQKRLQGSNEEIEMNDTLENPAPPEAFLCHASEDKDLVRRLAKGLMDQGVDVFFDEWEIRSGDSIRRKIDSGLGRCTHFIAILTPNSIDKEWVKTEMDSGFIQKVEGQSKFIPLRIGLEINALAPLLRPLLSPSLDDYENGLAQLVSDIYGISHKPKLGVPPAVVTERTTDLGVSASAESIVRLMMEKSERGDSMDPQLSPEEIR